MADEIRELDVDVLALLEELAEEIEPAITAEEFTVREYRERLKASGRSLSHRTAETHLLEKTEAGALKWRWVRVNGRRARGFSKAD